MTQLGRLTDAGRFIEQDSFAIIDREAQVHNYDERQWQVVRRMIHASADYDFNGLSVFHPQAIDAAMTAINNGIHIIADVSMITVGLSHAALATFGMKAEQYISDDDVIAAAHEEHTTRAQQAMRKAWKLGKLNNAIVAVGNAPTALLEISQLIHRQSARPALVIGMPVGFVMAEESKEEMAAIQEVPWIITRGRKGGSTLVVAAIHALLAIARQKTATS